MERSPMGSNRRAFGLAAILLVLACGLHLSLASELEGLDDSSEPIKPATSAGLSSGSIGEGLAEPPKPAPKARKTAEDWDKEDARSDLKKKFAALSAQGHIGAVEIGASIFLMLFAANVFRGRGINARMAKAWADAFAGPGGIFSQNFSMIGAGENGQALVKETTSCYKFYASGRRHVQGLLATLDLKPRQDILSMIWALFFPSEDTVTFEAIMNESSMPAIVIAVATPKAMKALKADHLDLSQYCKKMSAPKDAVPNWPDKKLHIMAEHSTVFSDLFGETKVQQILSNTGSQAKAFKYFRAAHFTSGATVGAHRCLIRMTFALPPANEMADIAPLVAMVPLFIDLVGSYKLSPDLIKKAEANRRRVQEEQKDVEDEKRRRLDALNQRKLQKLQAEKARIARLPPDQRQKEEEKLQKKQMEKAMKKRTVRG